MKRTRTRPTLRTTAPRPPRWTAQTMFTASAVHLLGMREKAALNGACRYRTPNGNRCAIGVLIPDDLYRVSFEKVALFHMEEVKTQPICKAAGITPALRPLAEALQNVHDAYELSQWWSKLTEIAARFNLRMPNVIEGV